MQIFTDSVFSVAFHFCISKHLQKAGFCLLPDEGADLGSNGFLYKFISHPLFQPCLSSLNFRSISASVPAPSQRPAAGLGTPPCRQFGFRFPCPTKSVTIHPSAFHLLKFCGSLATAGIFLKLFVFMGLSLEKKNPFTVSDRSWEPWVFRLIPVTQRSAALTLFHSVP